MHTIYVYDYDDVSIRPSFFIIILMNLLMFSFSNAY